MRTGKNTICWKDWEPYQPTHLYLSFYLPTYTYLHAYLTFSLRADVPSLPSSHVPSFLFKCAYPCLPVLTRTSAYTQRPQEMKEISRIHTDWWMEQSHFQRPTSSGYIVMNLCTCTSFARSLKIFLSSFQISIVYLHWRRLMTSKNGRMTNRPTQHSTWAREGKKCWLMSRGRKHLTH